MREQGKLFYYVFEFEFTQPLSAENDINDLVKQGYEIESITPFMRGSPKMVVIARLSRNTTHGGLND